MIRSYFKQSCINGNLNKEKFNESLSICENIGLKRLKDTPLGLRLFNIFNLAKDGNVSEEEFVVGMKGLITQQQKREEYTYKAYDTNNDGSINKEELLYIITQSWLSAFRILAERCQVASLAQQFPFQMPSRAQFEQFAQQKLPDLRMAVQKDFDKYDTMKRGFLDKQAFNNWIQQDRTIKAELAGIVVHVAVSFLHIEEPQIYPNDFQTFEFV